MSSAETGYPSLSPSGVVTMSGRLALARFKPALRILSALITVDLPQLFGPTRMFVSPSDTENLRNALKFRNSTDVKTICVIRCWDGKV